MIPVRVLVVEDSLMFRELLVRGLNSDPGIEVVATAGDPFEARDKILEFKPDVMTLDIELPRMSGLEFLRKLMPQYPVRTIVISSLSDKVFDALKAGAIDFVAKPSLSGREELDMFIRTELTAKIKIAAIVKIGDLKQKYTEQTVIHHNALRITDKVIAIGASTGGTEAILEVIKNFKQDVPGVVIVQHMPPGFTKMYADRLNNICEVNVKEAKNGDVVRQGLVLIAAGDVHMRLKRRGREYYVELSPGEKVSGHRPSVDVLFDSVADAAGSNAVGVILTGMGGDGAHGLLKMHEKGAKTIGQDEKSCIVYGMPKVAYDLGAVDYKLPLYNIAQKVYTLLE